MSKHLIQCSNGKCPKRITVSKTHLLEDIKERGWKHIVGGYVVCSDQCLQTVGLEAKRIVEKYKRENKS